MAEKGGGRRTMALKKMATPSARAAGGSGSRESSRSPAEGKTWKRQLVSRRNWVSCC